MIQMWAALESMSARLATLHAGDADIAGLRRLFDDSAIRRLEHLDEYSHATLRFTTRSCAWAARS